MKYAKLGATGIEVSRVCLGTMQLGSRLDEAQSVALLDRAVELGITFLDTGNIYPYPPGPGSYGRTEEIIGRWARRKRDQLVIATKCGFVTGPGPNDRGGSRKHIVEACEASLRRLQVNCIDLLYLHTWIDDTPLHETLEAFDHLVRGGKVHYVGLSNFEAWQLALAANVVTAGDLSRIAALQVSYSLVRRAPERDLFPLADALGIGAIPYYAVAAGLLSGKYDRTSGIPDDYRLFLAYERTGRGIDRQRQVDDAWGVVDTVYDVAREHDVSMTEVALAWVLGTAGVSATVAGASRPDQLDALAAAPDLELSAEARAALDAASRGFR